MKISEFLMPLFIIVLLYSPVSSKIKKSLKFSMPDIDNLIEPSDELYMDSTQILHKYGYACETHTIRTEDDYTLTAFRIPGSGPSIILLHGITDSSDAWLTLGPDKGLAYILANDDYDVWLLNIRGNKYSKKRNILPEKEYWKFSFEKMGIFDLTATIDYALEITSKNKLFYIGFSQGTTVLFSMLSLRPEYNDKIWHAFLLGPVAWTRHVIHPLIDFISQNMDKARTFLESAGIYELFPSNTLIDTYHATACRKNSIVRLLCDLEFFFSFGLHNSSYIPPDRFPIITSHVPAGTSVDSLVHFINNYNTGKFQRFNYGSKENFRRYGSPEPPEFDLSKVTSPLTLFASEQDWYANPKDVAKLLKSLPNVKRVVYFEVEEDFNHLEFPYGNRAKSLVYNPILKEIAEILEQGS